MSKKKATASNITKRNDGTKDSKLPPQSPSPSSTFSSTMTFVAGSVLGIAITLGVVMLFMGKTNAPATTTAIANNRHQAELEKIEHIRAQGKVIKDLFQALDYYEQAISHFPPKCFLDSPACATQHECAELSLACAGLMDEAGDAYHSVKQYAQAAELHRRALRVKEKLSHGGNSMNGVIYSHVSLANDLFKGGHIPEALDLVHQALSFPNLPVPLVSMLIRLQSIIYECDGDFVTSLHHFEQSLKLTPAESHPKDRQIEFMHVHRDLLRKSRTYHTMPPSVARAMEEKENEIDNKLLQIGPWKSPLQLPKVFLPNLTSKPWHDIKDYPQLQDAYETVIKAYPLLRAEYYQLAAKSLLSQEGECINDQHKGKWAVHDITSYWVRRDEVTGCSLAAPQGCQLFQNLKAMGFPVIRGGYSALAPGAWLRPHFGVTNGQLKFHLGLIVPKKENAQACAFMRVAQEIRGWEEGAITFFDDSYEHEVWNNCTTDRVVFQVVFVHPDLPPSYSREEIFKLPSH